MEIQRGDITLHVIPLTGLELQTPPAGSCFDRVVENVAKGYYIYGNYEGNALLEHFLGFGNYNQRINCTGFGLMLGRKGLPVDAEGNPAPLYLGLTTLEEISGDGIYQPDGWSKYGVLYPEDLPDPDTWYWVWTSFPDDPYPDVFHTLIAITDAYFEEGTQNYWLWGAIDGEIEEYPRHAEAFRGWNYGGWSPIPDMLCFFTWTECEVIKPTAVIDTPSDGATVTNPVHFGGHGVSNAGGVIDQYQWWIDGDLVSEAASFDKTLSLGAHEVAFLVHCSVGGWSDAAWIDITVGDISCTNPPGAEGQIDDCGVGYGNQPDATHKYKCVSGEWVDQGYNPDCVGIVCGDYTDITSCINAGCEWWNGECRSIAPTCIELDNKEDCERYNCYWYNDTCHAEPRPPTNYLPWIVVVVGISLIGVAVVKT